MNYSRLFRGAPMAFTFLFLIFVIYFLGGATGGAESSQQSLVNLGNVVMSLGIFAVGIPACLLLVNSQDISALKGKLASVLYLFVGAVALYLVFASNIQNYFGLEALPEVHQGLYLLSMLAAMGISVLYAIQAWPKNLRRTVNVWPTLAFFLAMGLSLGNLVLLSINVLVPNNSLLEVTMYLADIARRLIVAGALGQVLLYFSRQVPEKNFYTYFSMVGAFLYVLGFQSGVLRGGADEVVYFMQQLFHALGLTLILMAAGNLLFSIWQKKTLEIIKGGAWVSHSLFLVSIILLFISQGPLAATVLGGVHSALPLLLLLIAVPLSFQLRSESSTPKTSAAPISTALIWCGLLVSVMTMVLMAPIGAHFTFAGMSELQPLMGLLIGGMGMISLSLLISFWEIVLVEYI